MARMRMNGMRRDELDRMICGLMARGGIAAVGWEYGRLDNFFSHGVGAICGTHLCR